MKVVFRVDSSVEMGSGHLFRCLALADEIRKHGADILFVARNLNGNLGCKVIDKGHRLAWLQQPAETALGKGDSCGHTRWLNVSWEIDAAQTLAALPPEQTVDWLIVDSYSLDARWEAKVRAAVKRIMVIDDLADRPHDADLLLDQNLYRDMAVRYQELIPSDCRALLGPRYALLRPEFSAARRSLRKRDGSVSRILVFFGSSDRTNETLKVLEGIRFLDRPDIAVDVILGMNNAHREAVRSFAAAMGQVECHHNVNNMAELIARSDLFIGAAGITTWERCCLGLPSLVITVAQNQVQATKDLAAAGVIHFVGENDQIDHHHIRDALRHFLHHPGQLRNYSDKSLALVDGLGCARCAEAVSGDDELCGGWNG